MRYEFSFKDDEGDLYEEVYDTRKEAQEQMKALRADDCRIVETWIYNENHEFVGRF